MRDHQLDMNADCVDVDEEDDDDRRVVEWEDGLPAAGDLTPLTQFLIPPELACAFCITPELPRTALDVDRASQTTFSSLLSTPSPAAAATEREREGGGGGGDESSPRSSKKPRLVWTPQLHKRFVEVVAHLGLKNAVPKTIMQLMNVEGLTRENVASHLQKYRLYVKRMHSIFDDVTPSPTASATTGGRSRDARASGYAPGLVQPYAAVYGDNRFGSVVAHPPQHGRYLT